MTPWKFGGFGMFCCTFDRILLISAKKIDPESKDKEILIEYDIDRIKFQSGLNQIAISNAVTYPSNEYLKNLANHMWDYYYLYDGSGMKLVAEQDAPLIVDRNNYMVNLIKRDELPQQKGSGMFSEITLRVWKRVYDKEFFKSHYELVNEYTSKNKQQIRTN